MMEGKVECKPYNKCNDCESCVGDDDQIQVSVSPRRFSVPRSSEKRTKMEIKNKNPCPIYFKANTSNMEAFKLQPNVGRIPPHSKVSVIVQFCDSVRPLRHHEEVIVWTSMRPFDHMPLSDNICTYCLGAAHYHDYSHHQKVLYHPEQFYGREEYRYMPEKGPPQYSTFYESNGYHKVKDRGDDKKDFSTARREYGYASPLQRHFEPPSAKVRRIIDSTIDERPEFEEVCLHALVHRTASRQCECKNCADITFDQRHDVRVKEADYAMLVRGRRSSDPTLSLSKSERIANNFGKTVEERVQIEIHKDRREGPKADAKDKSKNAHVLARIVKTKDSTETSDTEISELSSRDMKSKKRTKFISEEDFKKKIAKAKKKKYQKQLEEESKSTTTSAATDIVSPIKESEKLVQKKSPAKALIAGKSSRCTFVTLKCPLEQVTWINLGLLVLLLLIVVGFFTYLYFALEKACEHHANCFLDLFSGL